MGWDLVNLEGSPNRRDANPKLWDDMCEKRYVADALKRELIRKENLADRAKEIKWGLQIVTEDGYMFCYLEAFLDGLTYRHGGAGWSCVGSAAIEKKITGRRLVCARSQSASVSKLIHRREIVEEKRKMICKSEDQLDLFAQNICTAGKQEGTG